MNGPAALFESSLSNLNLRARGKVRDIYDIDDQAKKCVFLIFNSDFTCLIIVQLNANYRGIKFVFDGQYFAMAGVSIMQIYVLEARYAIFMI
jgi:hypothetical protein